MFNLCVCLGKQYFFFLFTILTYNNFNRKAAEINSYESKYIYMHLSSFSDFSFRHWTIAKQCALSTGLNLNMCFCSGLAEVPKFLKS